MITFSIFRAKSPRVGMTARSSPRGRSVIPRSDRQRKKKDKRQRERDPTRANPRARRTVLVERIDKTGAAKGNTLYMPTTFPKCSVQFFAATSAAGSLWRASEWLRSFEVDARAKQTRTCSLAYASLRASAYTCIHARAPLVRACVRALRTCAYSRIAERRGKREKGSARFICPNFDGRGFAVAAPLTKNASRIRDLSRNMSYGGFSRRGSPRIRSLLFHHRVYSRRAESLQCSLCLKDEIKNTIKYFEDFRELFENFFTSSYSEFRIVSIIFHHYHFIELEIH